jgi:hypothetical protein
MVPLRIVVPHVVTIDLKLGTKFEQDLDSAAMGFGV